jgi:hypothetical protein
VNVTDDSGHLLERTLGWFDVLGIAPTITIATPNDTQTFVTGPSGAITGMVSDASALDSLVDIACRIDGGTACGGSSDPATGAFAFSFTGLADEHSAGGAPSHAVAITVRDRCGAAGASMTAETTQTATWTVDSTGPIGAFQEFDGTVVSVPPDGAENDTTGRAGAVAFTLSDPHSNPVGNVEDEPMPSVIALVDGLPQAPSCIATDRGAWLCKAPYDYPASPAGAATVAHYVHVMGNDAYGNAVVGTTTLHWNVDSAPPTLAIDPTPYRDDGVTPGNACADAESQVTLPHGVIRFASSDGHGSGATFSCTLSAGTTIVLAATACSAAISPSPLDDSTYQFAFAGLVDGKYTLAITASDRFSNVGTPVTTMFRVDGTPPSIAYITPGPGTIDIVAPDQTPFGTFSADGGTFTCTTAGSGGASAPCSPVTGYSVAVLAEGEHSVQITGTDCVGNTTVAPALRFDVDRSPPSLGWSGPFEFSSAQGDARLRFTAVDGITNIENLDCVLDEPNADPTARCDVDPSGLPTALHDTSFIGDMTFSGLSPGRHLLRAKASDRFGHVSPTFQVEFLMSYPPPAGHVVVIGNDFESGLTTELEEVLGNAAFASHATSFGRVLRVVMVDAAGGASAEEQANAANAICTTVQARRLELGQTCTCDSFDPDVCVAFTAATGAAVREDGLLGQDVVVILDQDARVGQVQAMAGDPIFRSRLREFATRGGIVIATSGADGTRPSNTVELVTDLVNLAVADQDLDVAEASRECDSHDPLVYDSATSFIDSLGALERNVRFVNLDRAQARQDTNEVFVSDHACSICGALPVVVDKYVPARTDLGPAYVHAYDDGATAVAGDAAFNAPNGSPAWCPLHGDGTVSHEVAAGTMVTIADANHPSLLQTLYDVAPYDDVVIGPTVPPSSFEVSISWTPPPITVDHYLVTTGCSSDIVAGDSTELTVTVTASCRSTSNGFDAAVWAFDATERPLAYAMTTFADLAPAAAVGGWAFRSFKLDAVPSPIFTPATDPIVDSVVGPTDAIYDGVPLATNCPTCIAGSVPAFPSAPSTVRAGLDLYYRDGGFGATTRTVANAGNENLVVRFTPASFLPHVVATMTADAVTLVTSPLMWAELPTSKTLDDTTGGSVSVYASDACLAFGAVTWRLWFSPSASRSTLPLPAGVTCIADPAAFTVTGIRVFADTTSSRAATHRAMVDAANALSAAKPAGAETRISGH